MSSAIRRTVCLLLSAALLSPALPQTPSDSVNVTATGDAIVDAEATTQTWLWGGAGLVLGPLGLLGSYYFHTSPPVYRLLGKSPEYLRVYGPTFAKRSDNIQRTWALVGCLASVVVVWSAYSATINRN